MEKKLKRIVFLITVALAAAAIVEQLRRPPGQRTWHGAILGVPYDFRIPTFRRVQESWWNPDDPRLFTPREFGVGWSVNLHRLFDIMGGPAREDGDG